MTKKHTKGFSLVEMVVYVSILAVVFVIVVNTLLIVSRSYSSIKISLDINNSATVSMERIISEIRKANSVNLVQSTFDSNPGRLVLNTVDNVGLPLIVDFYLEDDTLKLKEGGLFSGDLTDGVDVTNLVFRRISNDTSEAVKIEMELSNGSKNKVFYNTAVLRGSY
jgi:type II secretory pathway pseudopilin PulG